MKAISKSVQRGAITAAALAGLSAWSSYASAAVLEVGNNGVDRSACGTTAAPCRSISYAIGKAVAGDTILVGPGRYGDLNGNGIFGELGEEGAPNCRCMVLVDKPVILISRHGALTTILDAGRPATRMNVVRIAANGVVFGRAGHGFLITGSGGMNHGLVMPDAPRRVRIAGNIATGNSAAGIAVAGEGAVLRNNLAYGNSNSGFMVFDYSHVVDANAAFANPGVGFDLIAGNGHQLLNNFASGNSRGVYVEQGSHSVHGSRLIGNRGAGIELRETSSTIDANDIYGNGKVSDADEETTNCGLVNWANSVTAPQNYWGATTGPGADPADAVCDLWGGLTTYTPFASQAIDTTP